MTLEQFGNNAKTYLAVGISNSDTSVVIASATNFPSTGTFSIIIDEEIMLVTGVSGTTLTVERAQEGTVATAHDAGAGVVNALTVGSLTRLVGENLTTVRDSARPALNKLVDSSGATLTSSDFTWVNQGTSTITDLSSGGMIMVPQRTSPNNLHCMVKSYTAPGTVVMAFSLLNHEGVSTTHGGLCLRESATSKIMTLSWANVDELAVYKWTNETTFSAALFGRSDWPMGRMCQWFKIVDDNSDLYFYIGQDGINWQEIATEARGTFFTTGPDQWGFYTCPNSTFWDNPLTVFAWEES